MLALTASVLRAEPWVLRAIRVNAVRFIALLAGVHLWIALSVLVLGRAGRCNQGSVYRSTRLEQQALGCQQFVDGGQNLLGQLVLLQPVAKPQNGALIGHSSMGIKACKLPVDRRVKEGFFHRQIRQGEPLLHAVNAQHSFQGKGWAAVLAFGVIRRNDFNQCSPGNHPIHLGQQFLLAGLLGTQVQVKAALLHACEHAMTELHLSG